MKTRILILLLSILTPLITGCRKGMQMDYGEVEAQFTQDAVASKGKAFVGKKVTVRGTVTKVGISDPKAAWLELENGIRCNLGEMRKMAEGAKVGETVYVDGILERCDEGDVLIEPAILRDPTAPFTPH